MAQQSVKWLFRSRGWIIPPGAVCFWGPISAKGATPNISSEAIQVYSTWLASCRSSPAPTVAALRCFRTAPTTSAEVPAPGEMGQAQGLSSNASGGLRMPGWLRNVFAGSKKASKGKPGSLESPTPAAPVSTGREDTKESADAEDIKVLEELRTMSMEGYVEYCKKMRSGCTPPRPRLPPLGSNLAELRVWVDDARVSYLRMLQHERIGSLITKEEGDFILANSKEVLCNRAFMEAIANRTGVYIDLEVKDCIEQFVELRKKTGRMHRFVTEFGHPLPKTMKEQEYALRFMERTEGEEELKAALARRDTVGCPLRLKLPWVGPSALCELSGRPYRECCGRATAGARPLGDAAKWQRPAYPGKPDGNELLPDRERQRFAHRKLKGHVKSKLRRACILATKPRILRGVGDASFWKPE